jgi:serine/threonine-protein phosphatase 2B catalytic subunit
MDIDDRIIKEVNPPPKKPIFIENMLAEGCLPDWKLIKSHLASGGFVSRKAAIYLISQCKFLFQKEPAIIEIYDPVTIVGDIHGQLYDLLFILDRCSFISENILFLGDYVDRGKFSVEVVLMLFALKINFPRRIILIRGNHESRLMTSHFSFRKEMIYKYDLEVYDMIMESFDCLPLACIVNNEIFAVHGGISPFMHFLKDVQGVDRFVEPPSKGILCDLLWADPEDDENRNSNFSENKSRGCSVRFGMKAVKTFLKSNKLKTIIRAHQVQPEGYKFHSWLDKPGCIPVITVFSAANYCETIGNRGAFLSINDSVVKIKQFNSNPQPFDLPCGMDAFSWSVPFVIEQVINFFNRALRKSEGNSPVSPQLVCSFSDLEQDFNEKMTQITESEKKIQDSQKNGKVSENLASKTEEDQRKIIENEGKSGNRRLEETQKELARVLFGLSEKKCREIGFKRFLTDEDYFLIGEKIGKFLSVIHDEYKIESLPKHISDNE